MTWRCVTTFFTAVHHGGTGNIYDPDWRGRSVGAKMKGDVIFQTPDIWPDIRQAGSRG